MSAMKKTFAVLLAFAMLFSLFACGNSTPSTSKDSVSTQQSSTADNSSEAAGTGVTFPLAEPVTYSMFTIINNNVELGDTLAFKKLTEMTNVHWTIQSVLAAEIGEKRNLLLASGDYPDVFYRSALDDATAFKYGTKGTFIPLNDLAAQHAPNFTKLLDSRPGARDIITMGDGNIYSLPQLVRPGAGWLNLFVNQPWLTKLGLKMPTTLDEFYDTLVAFKTQNPNGKGAENIIPLICIKDWLYYFIPYFGVQFDPGSGSSNMAMIDGQYTHFYSHEKYKEFLAFMTKLYKEKLLDKNTFIQSNDQQHAIGSSGDIIGFFFDLASFLTVGRERDADFVRVPVFSDHVLPYAAGVGSGALAITDKCKNPEIVISWVDHLYSEEGGILAFMGVENETYKMNSDGSWDWILGDYSDVSALRAASCIQGGALDPSMQPDLWFENKSDVNEYKFNHDRPVEREINLAPFPVLKYSEDDQKTLATISADLSPYITQYQAQVVTGQLTLDSSWQEYINTMDKMGLRQLIDITTKAYEQAKNK